MLRPLIRRSGIYDSVTLAVGSIVSGLAAYGFIAVGNRAIGSIEFAAVSVLWSFWAMSAAVLTFPVQHWVIRTVEADGGEARVRRSVPTLTVAAAGLSVTLGLVCWLLRFRLFDSGGFLFPALAAAVPFGSLLMGLNRGVLASRRRFGSMALAIAGENVIRLVAAVMVGSAAGLGIALVAGFAVAVFWPSSFVLGRSGSMGDQVSPLSFVGGVAGGSLIGQIVMTTGPIALALIGGAPAEITSLFSALALFRAPYMVGIGVTPRLTAGLTRVVLDHGRSAIRRLVMRTVVVAVILLATAFVFGWTVGPWLLTVVFGSDVVLSSKVSAVVAGASAIALCALFLTVMLVAAARIWTVSISWVVAAAAAAVVLILGPATPVQTVAQSFLIAEVVAFSLMVLGLLMRRSLHEERSMFSVTPPVYPD